MDHFRGVWRSMLKSNSSHDTHSYGVSNALSGGLWKPCQRRHASCIRSDPCCRINEFIFCGPSALRCRGFRTARARLLAANEEVHNNRSCHCWHMAYSFRSTSHRKSSPFSKPMLLLRIHHLRCMKLESTISAHIRRHGCTVACFNASN